MNDIDFTDSGKVLELLSRIFPTQPVPVLPKNMLGMDDPERVYLFFNQKTWLELATDFSLTAHAYAADLGVTFLRRGALAYYAPFYIYASIVNNGWTYEDGFLDFLFPAYSYADEFMDIFFTFPEDQLKVIAQFVKFECSRGEEKAERALRDFWGMYI
ncbi:hypothetical protein [Burkholderia aenigmatica]|uniref:hypothetical protein n=1 Tax=Burkholderia aenigmatica TaxID=2015348 RepID=UPI002652112A|nr:hypothetical protein [Burkholderia aenigmatica]MDN7879361.1 hypothetical protein [Burkholderia aenigmatica]